MTRLIIEYDKPSKIAEKIIDLIYSVDDFKVKEEKEECPYDKEFMKKLEMSKKSKNDKAIAIEDLWK
jgi:hypothetical protein